MRLTPFDAECLRMVESLTGRETVPEPNEGGYSFEVYYEGRDPDWAAAVLAAIEGRYGERLIRMEDEPEQGRCRIFVRASVEALPDLYEMTREWEPRPDQGHQYESVDRTERVYAIQFLLKDAERVLKFIGNGQIEAKDGAAVLHFRNTAGEVYATAQEGQYIVHLADTRFLVEDAEQFEAQWQRVK